MAAPHSKAELRRRMRQIRAACDPAWGQRLAGHFLASCPPRPGQIVSGFWPLGDEIDIRPLLLALAGRGHVVALPATPSRGQPLTFHRWRPGDELHPEPFGTVRPGHDPVVPDVLLVPLLAFDRVGHRLGYGGGFYDRTLELLAGSRAIGCAYAAQQIAEIPAEPHDRPLDAIATEQRVFMVES